MAVQHRELVDTGADLLLLAPIGAACIVKALPNGARAAVSEGTLGGLGPRTTVTALICMLAYAAPASSLMWGESISLLWLCLAVFLPATMFGMYSYVNAPHAEDAVLRMGSFLKGVGVAGVTVGITFAFLAGENKAPSLAKLGSLFGPAAVAAGFRPVFEVFLRERARPRLDSHDVLCLVGGCWMSLSGLIASLMVPLGGLGWIPGAAVAAAGIILMVGGAMRQRRRLRWLRQVELKMHTGWSLDAGTLRVRPLPALLGAPHPRGYDLVLLRGVPAGGGYREVTATYEQLGTVPLVLPEPRGGAMAWAIVVSVVGTLAAVFFPWFLVSGGWLFYPPSGK